MHVSTMPTTITGFARTCKVESKSESGKIGVQNVYELLTARLRGYDKQVGYFY